jgi:hypothetical protein
MTMKRSEYVQYSKQDVRWIAAGLRVLADRLERRAEGFDDGANPVPLAAIIVDEFTQGVGSFGSSLDALITSAATLAALKD